MSDTAGQWSACREILSNMRALLFSLGAIAALGTSLSGQESTASPSPIKSPISTPESAKGQSRETRVAKSESSSSNALPAMPGEKIRDISPDKKFAMRISYDAEMNQGMIQTNTGDSNKIFSQTINSIDLISLPEKTVVAKLLEDQRLGKGSEYDFMLLVWSADSNWCAFYVTAPRIGYTVAYHKHGNQFMALNDPEQLSVKFKGSINHEYIRPVEWVKSGVLVLEQSATFKNSDDEAARFNVKFDPKTGEFFINWRRRVTGKLLPHGYD